MMREVRSFPIKVTTRIWTSYCAVATPNAGVVVDEHYPSRGIAISSPHWAHPDAGWVLTVVARLRRGMDLRMLSRLLFIEEMVPEDAS